MGNTTNNNINQIYLNETSLQSNPQLKEDKNCSIDITNTSYEPYESDEEEEEEEIALERYHNNHLIASKNINKEPIYTNDISIEEDLFNYKKSLIEENNNTLAQSFITKNRQKLSNHNSFESSFRRKDKRYYSLPTIANHSLIQQRLSLLSFYSSDRKGTCNNANKTKDNRLRNSYISKLMNYEVNQYKQKEEYNNLIIFDWDDTLLCSSYILPDGNFTPNTIYDQKDQTLFDILDSTVYTLLSKSIEMGLTFIITNSVPGWVEYSSKRFYPKVNSILPQLTIISSRGKYESMYPNDALQWKVNSFRDIKEIASANQMNNILSFGDSFIELEASQTFASKYNDVYIKSIKLMDHPNPIELNKQLLYVTKSIKDLISAERSFKMQLSARNKSYIYQSFDI